MGRSSTVAALACVALAAGVCPGAAQEGDGLSSDRPFNGLFGGAEPLASRGQSLSLTLAGFGGWDEAPSELGLPAEDAEERVELSGMYGGGSATLSYSRVSDRLTLGAYGSTFSGYFPDSGTWYDSQGAGATASTSLPISARGTLGLAQQATYATEYGVGFPQVTGDPLLADGGTGFDTSLERDPSIHLTSDVDYTYDLSTKSSLSAFYAYRTRVFFRDNSERSGYDDQVVGARFQRSLTRYASLRLGYSYRRPRVGGRDESGREPRSYALHDVDAGVNYARSLSLTRKTTVTFSTGSTVAATASDRPDVPEETGDEDPGLFNDPRLFLVGSASINREIGRSWTAQAAYSRSVSYAEGFSAPALSDSVTAGLQGLLTSRLDFTSRAYYSTAAVGLDDRNYTSVNATTQLRAGLTKKLAAYVSHYYVNYRFDEQLEIPGGVPRRVERQGIRFGLSAWLPLWSKR